MKFEAGIHGIDLEKVISETKKEDEEKRLMFRDPKEYESMSTQEREELTQQMMSKWKNWASQADKALGSKPDARS